MKNVHETGNPANMTTCAFANMYAKVHLQRTWIKKNTRKDCQSLCYEATVCHQNEWTVKSWKLLTLQYVRDIVMHFAKTCVWDINVGLEKVMIVS